MGHLCLIDNGRSYFLTLLNYLRQRAFCRDIGKYSNFKLNWNLGIFFWMKVLIIKRQIWQLICWPFNVLKSADIYIYEWVLSASKRLLHTVNNLILIMLKVFNFKYWSWVASKCTCKKELIIHFISEYWHHCTSLN